MNPEDTQSAPQPEPKSTSSDKSPRQERWEQRQQRRAERWEHRWDKHHDRDIAGGITCGAVLIGAGIIFMLNNLGIVSWSIWDVVWRFWPVLIILFGLQIIAGSNRLLAVFVGLISIAVVVTVLGLAVVWTSPQAPQWLTSLFPANSFNFINGQTPVQHSDQLTAETDFTGVTSRSITTNTVSGEFTMTDDLASGYVRVASDFVPGHGDPVIDAHKTGDQLQFDFSGNYSSLINFMNTVSPKYILQIGRPTLPTDISVQMTSGSGTIDLASLNLHNLDIHMTSGSMVLKLAAQVIPSQQAHLDMTSGQATLTIPQTAGLKITYSQLSGSLVVDGNRLTGNGVYTSDNYAAALNKLDLKLDMTSGSATVEFTK